MKFFTEADVERLLTMNDALEAVQEAFALKAAGQAQNRPRQRAGGGALLQVMPAAIPGLGVMGFKAYTSSREGARFMVFLFDSESGKPLAAIQGNRLGQLRTGAATGVACRFMARPESRVLALVGCGYQAETQLAAVASVLPIEEARVFCRTPGRAEAFGTRMQPSLPGVRLVAAATVHQAVEGADVVVTVTNSKEPVVPDEAVAPGTCICAAGSNHAARRELAAATVLGAHRVVVDDLAQARLECGDLLGAESAGFSWDKVVELADVVAARYPGRERPDEITLFESQGVALEDVALGARLLKKAEGSGIGRTLPGDPGLWG
ncbi:MAG: ornithine cyclodeaminase family protein [Bacillota bacterium]